MRREGERERGHVWPNNLSPVSIGWPEAEAGDLGKLKLNIWSDEDELQLGWVWPWERGGCGEEEEEGIRGDWRGFSVREGESSWRKRERQSLESHGERENPPTPV